MTEREGKIERAKCEVIAAQVRVRTRSEKLARGTEEAMAIYYAKVATLREEYQLAVLDLETERIYLKELEASPT